MTPAGKAASVHDRLLAKARMSGNDFNLLLTQYALERFLYRISVSRFQESFHLKGALLFSLWYDTPPDSIQAMEIHEDARYGGIRIDLIGMLGTACCPVQIDIGYGEAVTPALEFARFPAILEDNPAPILRAYPRETVIAEMLEAIVSLGVANSRMKDFFDLQALNLSASAKSMPRIV